MPEYRNGEVPESLLVKFDSGWDLDGYYEHLLPPSTYRKHLKLVELADKRNDGRHLRITPGWSCYRPLDPQRVYRARYGFGASEVGKSSHGLFWEGRQVAAIDYSWEWAYGGDRDAWFADVRAAGLTPGLIHPSRGNNYPDEPWHVIDEDPWAPVMVHFEPTVGEEMLYFQWKDDPAKVVYVLNSEVGQPSMRVCGAGEAAIARALGRVGLCDQGTLLLVAKEAGYEVPLKRTDVGKRMASAVWNGETVDRAGAKNSMRQEVADIGTIVRKGATKGA